MYVFCPYNSLLFYNDKLQKFAIIFDINDNADFLDCKKWKENIINTIYAYDVNTNDYGTYCVFINDNL